MTEQNGSPMNDAAILDELRVSDSRIETLKTEIASCEAAIQVEVQRAMKLYRMFRDSNAVIAEAAHAIWADNPAPKKLDKRKEQNPIKQLNIGVKLSYRHSKVDGYKVRIVDGDEIRVIDGDEIRAEGGLRIERREFTADEARERAYQSIYKKAMSKGIHAADCTCAGETKNCSSTLPKYVKQMSDLPVKVVAKIEEAYAEYDRGKQTKTKRVKKAQAAS